MEKKETIIQDDYHPIKGNLNNTTPKIYSHYWISLGFSILFGMIMKLLFSLKREDIGKKSILTGIPILRTKFFLCPTLLNLTLFIYIIYLYNKSSLKQNYNNSIIKYLKKIRCGYLITNLILFFYFFLIYHKVFIPVFKVSKFKMSGHVFASILSGAMLIHLNITSKIFIDSNIEINNMKIFSLISKILLYHNVYVIFWSSWIFHTVVDLLLSFFFGIMSLSFIHLSNFDKLILTLMDTRIKIKKKNNFLYENNLNENKKTQ